ncbi:U-box domain-containing protein [Legionella fallonii]|uniref:U-box domain-containing protein n=1 Tax=Legionella fallonii LLAP-10 TaxID=1212491 RepID=A0A098G362_9GAMM|nr:U-box domain-containing protein [Legionella fallonii]CEG56917.1 protein of unknown function [U-box domain] [Legionella fallonii LLAP-10]
MQMKEEQYENSDLVCCPITQQPIRHPIFASDGIRYELKDLCKWLLGNNFISPITKQTITSITYDTKLKEKLDELNIPERYENYDKDEYQVKLTDAINSIYNPWKQSAYKSVATVNACLLVFFMYLLMEEENPMVQTKSTLLYIVFGGLIDYLMRVSTNDRYSFFSLINRPVSALTNYILPPKEVPPVEEQKTDENQLVI